MFSSYHTCTIYTSYFRWFLDFSLNPIWWGEGGKKHPHPLWDIEGRRLWGQRRWAHDVEGRRLWGQTTLRADDFEGRRLWGQVFCTWKIFALNVACPQSRATLRANIAVAEQFHVIWITKIFALNVARRWGQATLRANFWIIIFWLCCESIVNQNYFEKIIKIQLGKIVQIFKYWIYDANITVCTLERFFSTVGKNVTIKCMLLCGWEVTLCTFMWPFASVC